jgi:dTDP-4-amino-4,6-dideoxygalactose transaminase
MALKGDHLHGDGTFSQNAAKLISDKVGGGKVLLTPSCTHALEMASMLINLSPGDEVILPTYTFTSAATAITKFGATPVFVDIDEQTKGINVDQVVQAITSRTKAISWVNYAGTAPEIERIQKIAEENRIFLIEDNAHGLGGRYKGKVLGSFGDLATQSFHGTKNIQCGEGGALVINNINLFERAEIIREKGTDRSKYLRGDIQKYQWIDQGSSYLLAEPLAALLQGNLEEFNRIHSHRLEIWNHYYEALKLNPKIVLNIKPESEDTNIAHIFFLNIEDKQYYEQVLERARSEKIQITSHYQPLHNSIAGLKFGKSNFTYNNAENFSKTILRLPLYSSLTKKDISRITSLFR